MNDRPRIYGFEGSHPCEAVRAAAAYKGVEYDFTEVPPALHRLVMPFIVGGPRVPAAKHDGRRLRGTTAIFRLLDELEPERPLFPNEPELRERVESAEQWGEGEIQDVGRRLAWAHLSRSPETIRVWAMRAQPGFGRTVKLHGGPFFSQVAKYGNSATDKNVRSDLAALPVHLDTIDALIADGTIGGDQPNAADFQILSTVGVWIHISDLREPIMQRPCGAAAARLFPDYDGSIPGGLLPDEWFEPVRARVPSAA